MENSDEQKKKVGRPRIENSLPPDWKEMILQSGREGKNNTDYLIKLNISAAVSYDLIKRNKEFAETIEEYKKLCEQWWFNKAQEAFAENKSNTVNQKLWLTIMKNKFRDNWKDDKSVDVTTNGDKITQPSTIQIEIIKPDIED